MFEGYIPEKTGVYLKTGAKLIVLHRNTIMMRDITISNTPIIGINGHNKTLKIT